MKRRAFTVLAKPTGSQCNLRCDYCFYLEKEALYPQVESFRMSLDVLETFIRQYIAALEIPEISFVWQGGEPTVLGIEFYENVLRLQSKYAGNKRITNSIQTNGILLDDAWCDFLARNHFLVGLSLDGPEDLHDIYRVDQRGEPTFKKVMRSVARLKKHGVDFNTLTVVNRKNSCHPREVYRFLKEAGSGYIQFIPLVERAGSPGSALSAQVTDASVEAEQYGAFLVEIFDEWVRRDVGRVFVQLFDVALGNWLGAGSSLCLFAENCGAAPALEHNGDLYACDHYVDPHYLLGNIMQDDLHELATSTFQNRFGQSKSLSLPRVCHECEVRFACQGECPKNRFLYTAAGEEGLNYLCPAYKQFFRYIDGPMRLMANLWQQQKPPSEVMRILASPPQ